MILLLEGQLQLIIRPLYSAQAIAPELKPSCTSPMEKSWPGPLRRAKQYQFKQGEAFIRRPTMCYSTPPVFNPTHLQISPPTCLFRSRPLLLRPPPPAPLDFLAAQRMQSYLGCGRVMKRRCSFRESIFTDIQDLRLRSLAQRGTGGSKYTLFQNTIRALL